MERSFIIFVFLFGLLLLQIIQPTFALPSNHIPDDAPTLGTTSDSKKQVSLGFTYNGKGVNVKPFFTPYKLQYTQVGQENIAKFKIFDYHGPNNVAHFELAFGLDKGQIPNDSKIRIEWDKSELGEEKITIIDPNHVLDNVRIETGVEKCKGGGKTDCLTLTIYHTFRESPEFKIIATSMWNYQRYSWTNYFNHGLQVDGDSINPPDTYTGIYHGRIFQLTESGKNKAVDINNNTWTFEHGTWNKDDTPTVIIPDRIWTGMSRSNNQFYLMVENQTNIAESKLKEICKKCSDPNYAEIMDIKEVKFKKNFEKLKAQKLAKIAKIQNDNATQRLDEMFKKMYPGKVFNEEKYRKLCINCGKNMH